MKNSVNSVNSNGKQVASDRLLNPKQLADVFDVRPGTVYSWLSRGVELPPFLKIGSLTRWRESVVWAWIEAKERERKRRNFEI